MDHSLPGGCYVILHIGTGPSRGEQKGHSPLVVQDSSARFALSDDIWIERLDEHLAKHIQEACEPPHYKISDAGYDRHLYAFVQRIPAVGSTNNDLMTELMATIALSQLIHPTSTGDRYCANVFHFGLRESAIQAIQNRGMSPDVFLSGKDRDWLSVGDAEALRRLMPWVSKDKAMHPRVHRAYWNHEY